MSLTGASTRDSTGSERGARRTPGGARAPGSGRCVHRRRYRAYGSRQPSPPANPPALRLRPVTREEGQGLCVPRSRGDLPEGDPCNLKKVGNLLLKLTQAARRTAVSNSGAARVVCGRIMPANRPPRSGAPSAGPLSASPTRAPCGVSAHAGCGPWRFRPPGGDCAPAAAVKTDLQPRFRFAPNWQTRTLKSNDRLSLPGLFHLRTGPGGGTTR